MNLIKKINFKRVLTFAAALYVAAFMVFAGGFAANEGYLVNHSRYSPVANGGGTTLANNGVLDSILEVFTSVGEWISQTVPTFYSLFYTVETGLTFLGVMAVASLAFAVVFLNSLGCLVSDDQCITA